MAVRLLETMMTCSSKRSALLRLGMIIDVFIFSLRACVSISIAPRAHDTLPSKAAPRKDSQGRQVPMYNAIGSNALAQPPPLG